MVRIHVIQTGSTLVSSAVPNRAAHANPLAYTGLFQSRQKRISVPVKCFLFEINDRRILVDAGWSNQCATNAKEHLGFGLWFASEPVLAEDEGLAGQLNRLGVSPADIDAVLMTHLDCDHASGLADVRGAKSYYVTREELEAGNKGGARYRPAFWEGVTFTYYSMAENEKAPFSKQCNIFGDGSVIVYFTPTHSPGSVAIAVRNNGKYALFTGDNAYNRHSWEEGCLPGPLYNRENEKRVLAWIADHANNPDCAAILCAHDPEVPAGEIVL